MSEGSEVENVKRLAVKINDWLVVGGFIIVLVVGALMAFGSLFSPSPVASLLVVVLCTLVALLVWAIGAGTWCVLSGIHYELKKLNAK